MLVDYRKRCARDVEIDGLKFTVVRYGATAAETDDPMSTIAYYELKSPYAELSRGGRRPGNAIENERSRHFFNKRIMTDEEKHAVTQAQVRSGHVQSRSDVGVVGALYGEGRTGGVKETQTTEECTGGGDQDFEYNGREDMTT